MHLKSHINRCCQVSPNMLSKHHQSWGSCTCQCLQMYCQSTNNYWGSHVNSGLFGFHCTVRVPSFPVWGCCLYCQSTNLMHLKVTSTVVAECLQICCPKHHQSWGSCTCQCLLMYCQSTNNYWGSHINRCCQVSPNMLFKAPLILRELHFSVSPNVLSKYQHLLRESRYSGCQVFSNCTVKVPTNPEGVTCWVSPNVLSKYQHLTEGVIPVCCQTC